MGRRKVQANGLTEAEETVLTMVVVGQRLARHGCGPPPSYRDMGLWMGWSSPNTVYEVLDRLEARGYIRRSGARSRAIEVIR